MRVISVLYADATPLCGRVQTYTAQLSARRLEKIGRLPAGMPQALSAGVELLLNEAVRRQHPTAPLPLLWETQQQGKPYLPDLPACFFSLSHSGRYVLCAVGDTAVGADVQRMDDRRTESMAARFFAPSEQEWLQRQPPHTRVQAFFRLWTCKESYLKYTGEGLSLPLSDFQMDMEAARTVRDGVPQSCRFFEHAETSVQMAVCAETDVVRWEVFHFSAAED